MTAPLWVCELAGMFWREAGFIEGFPRSLREAVDLSSFELTIKDRPGLSIDGVENYLAHQGVCWRCGAADRWISTRVVLRRRMMLAAWSEEVGLDIAGQIIEGARARQGTAKFSAPQGAQ